MLSESSSSDSIFNRDEDYWRGLYVDYKINLDLLKEDFIEAYFSESKDYAYENYFQDILYTHKMSRKYAMYSRSYTYRLSEDEKIEIYPYKLKLNYPDFASEGQLLKIQLEKSMFRIYRICT